MKATSKSVLVAAATAAAARTGRTFMGIGGRARDPEERKWWWVNDSNVGRRKPADLQSAPVGHLGNPPRERNGAKVCQKGGPKSSAFFGASRRARYAFWP